jgi:hypothetical protein
MQLAKNKVGMFRKLDGVHKIYLLPRLDSQLREGLSYSRMCYEVVQNRHTCLAHQIREKLSTSKIMVWQGMFQGAIATCNKQCI